MQWGGFPLLVASNKSKQTWRGGFPLLVASKKSKQTQRRGFPLLVMSNECRNSPLSCISEGGVGWGGVVDNMYDWVAIALPPLSSLLSLLRFLTLWALLDCYDIIMTSFLWHHRLHHMHSFRWCDIASYWMPFYCSYCSLVVLHHIAPYVCLCYAFP